jgi:two-component system cell cycle sensor histidine kinase/response regulator CckA
MALQQIVTKLLSSRRWPLYLTAIIALLSEFFTAIMNSINSMIWWGRVDRDLLVIGCIDAFVVTLLVSPVAIYYFRHVFNLEDMNRRLQEEIDERERVERALRESEDRLRVITENMMDTITQVDAEGQILYASPSTERMSGHAYAELISQTWLNQVHEEDSGHILKEIRKAEAGSAPSLRLEYRYRHADGRYLWVESEIRLLYDQQGRLISAILSSRDITVRKHAEAEQKRLEEMLQQSKKMEALGLLAGGVAHDLNNILGGVVGYPDLLLMQLPESSPFRKALLTIKSSGERAAAVVQDLLTLARRNIVVDKVFSINQAVRDYILTLEFEKLKTLHPNVHFQVTLAPDLINIKGSPVHFGKVVMNLISNAFEAVCTSGQVAVITENVHLDSPLIGFEEIAAGEYVRLSISDSGSGIHSRDLERIFEPFYTKKKMGVSGTGLGLAVVWGVVKDHRGFIDVHSREGRGTTFFLYFPAILEEVDSRDIAVSIEDCRGRGESVLVVDDEGQQRELASGILTELGYKVQTLPSGEEALKYLSTTQVDVVVLDMIMDPGMDGLETYRKILAHHPCQKAIIVSGFSGEGRVAQARALGAGTYVSKPYLMDRLGVAVRQELDRDIGNSSL